jgi:hypothetical protein
MTAVTTNSMALVSTKEALKQAVADNAQEIVITGPFVQDFNKAKKIATLSAVTLTLVLAAAGIAVATAPETFGLSVVAGAAAATALSGMEIAVIIGAASIGIALILAVHKDYEEITCDKDQIILRKKQAT